MRKVIALVLVLAAGQLQAQNEDSFLLYSDVFVSFLPMTVGGVEDLADSGFGGTASSTAVPNEPEYGFNEVSALAVRYGAHLNLRVPMIKKPTFSIGLNVSLGGGQQIGVSNSDGLNSFILDFPEYAYFRSTKGNKAHSLMVGYRVSVGGLKMKNPMLAWELEASDGMGLRLNATLMNQKYYMNDQFGTLTPIFKGSEYGAAMIFYF